MRISDWSSDVCSSDLLTFRVDHESTAVSQANFFDQHVEVAGDDVGRVANHGVLDFANGWRGVVPGSVSKVSVGGNAVDFDTQLLEFSVVVGQVFQLGDRKSTRLNSSH